MTHRREIRVSANPENLPKIYASITRFCKDHALDLKTDLEYRLHLIAEEIFMNLNSITACEERENVFFQMALQQQEHITTTTLKVPGPAFNPLEDAPEPDIDSELSERAIGGLGLMLVRETADQIRWSYDSGANILVIIFGSDGISEVHSAAREDGHIKDIQTVSRRHPSYATLSVNVVLAFLLVFGLGISGSLNTLKFEKLLNETIAERYDPVLLDLTHAIQNSLEEGLTLNSTRSTQRLIERSTEQFDSVFSLAVHDLRKQLLFRVGEVSSAPIFPPDRGKVIAERFGDSGFLRHMTIFQGDLPVGTLSLAHHTQPQPFSGTDVGSRMQNIALIFSLPILFVLLILTMFLIGRIEGQIQTRTSVLTSTRHADR